MATVTILSVTEYSNPFATAFASHLPADWEVISHCPHGYEFPIPNNSLLPTRIREYIRSSGSAPEDNACVTAFMGRVNAEKKIWLIIYGYQYPDMTKQSGYFEYQEIPDFEFDGRAVGGQRDGYSVTFTRGTPRPENLLAMERQVLAWRVGNFVYIPFDVGHSDNSFSREFAKLLARKFVLEYPTPKGSGIVPFETTGSLGVILKGVTRINTGTLTRQINAKKSEYQEFYRSMGNDLRRLASELFEMEKRKDVMEMSKELDLDAMEKEILRLNLIKGWRKTARSEGEFLVSPPPLIGAPMPDFVVRVVNRAGDDGRGLHFMPNPPCSSVLHPHIHERPCFGTINDEINNYLNLGDMVSVLTALKRLFTGYSTSAPFAKIEECLKNLAAYWWDIDGDKSMNTMVVFNELRQLGYVSKMDGKQVYVQPYNAEKRPAERGYLTVRYMTHNETVELDTAKKFNETWKGEHGDPFVGYVFHSEW